MAPSSCDVKSNLTECSFFDYMPTETLAEITRKFQTKTFPAGTVLFQQGDPGDSYYFIQSGRIRAFRKEEHGLVIDLAELGPGDGFGEIALLTGKPRTASVQTVEETVLTILTKEQFDKILEKYPQVALSFVKHMSKMLLQDWSKLEKETQAQYLAPRISRWDFILMVGITIICGILFNLANPNGISFFPELWSEEPIAALTPSTAHVKSAQGEAIIVDARPSSFYIQEHIIGAINLPSEVFDIAYLMELAHVDKSTEIIVYGRTISSRYDEEVANKLRLRGHKNVTILAGGLPGWKKKGYPVEL